MRAPARKWCRRRPRAIRAGTPSIPTAQPGLGQGHASPAAEVRRCATGGPRSPLGGAPHLEYRAGPSNRPMSLSVCSSNLVSKEHQSYRRLTDEMRVSHAAPHSLPPPRLHNHRALESPIACSRVALWFRCELTAAARHIDHSEPRRSHTRAYAGLLCTASREFCLQSAHISANNKCPCAAGRESWIRVRGALH
jgi:hypothetical protein